MTTTRSSARRASGEASKDEGAAPKKGARGTKRSSDTLASRAKRGKTEGGKQQKSIEETMDLDGKTGDDDHHEKNGDEKAEPEAAGRDEPAKAEDQPTEAPKEEEQSTAEEKTETKPEGHAVIEDPERAEAMPSTILEKGIIYFFFRGRVGVEEPQGVQDVARSYIVLRPLPLGAKLGEGPLEDLGNNRLLALPKKVLPVSHRDRFMTFVEKAKTTVQDLKENFLAGSDYETKTAGARHAPAATPTGEGVYAITTTGRESHLSYILTVPSEISEVQQELGLRQRASFVTSVKNPTVGGPANAQLPNPAKFDQDIMDEFRNRGWMPLQAKVLDYEHAQILLIGEDSGELHKAVEPSEKDKKHDKETPLEEMEKLEHEDDIRIQHLKGEDPVLQDLGASSEDYAKLQTTW
ncbi:MAG: hypothetical protein M1823_003275 [Watsoniomyces obsoletus]|nr:MAG: hypothetical protein M1823_003275 [Watsoniomyces obsoletus]